MNFSKLIGLFVVFNVSINCYSNAQEDRRVINVPVIFHIIYSDNNPDNGINASTRLEGNSTTNIPYEKLIAELKDLDSCFQMINKDINNVPEQFKARRANPKVHFYLAKEIFQEGGKPGIIRIYSQHNGDNLYLKSDIIQPDQYLNIYVGRIGSSFVWPYPWAKPKDDAVHLDYKWIGLHYRLLAHETGHWFGLWHIYGGEGQCEGDCDEGDDIADTPPQARCTDVDCLTCPPDISEQRCQSDIATNYNNYMDYSGCRNMFTAGQVAVMRSNIINHRRKLWDGLKK